MILASDAKDRSLNERLKRIEPYLNSIETQIGRAIQNGEFSISNPLQSQMAQLPWPDGDTAELMRQYLEDYGYTVEANFRRISWENPSRKQ